MRVAGAPCIWVLVALAASGPVHGWGSDSDTDSADSSQLSGRSMKGSRRASGSVDSQLFVKVNRGRHLEPDGFQVLKYQQASVLRKMSELKERQKSMSRLMGQPPDHPGTVHGRVRRSGSHSTQSSQLSEKAMKGEPQEPESLHSLKLEQDDKLQQIRALDERYKWVSRQVEQHSDYPENVRKRAGLRLGFKMTPLQAPHHTHLLTEKEQKEVNDAHASYLKADSLFKKELVLRRLDPNLLSHLVEKTLKEGKSREAYLDARPRLKGPWRYHQSQIRQLALNKELHQHLHGQAPPSDELVHSLKDQGMNGVFDW